MDIRSSDSMGTRESVSRLVVLVTAWALALTSFAVAERLDVALDGSPNTLDPHLAVSGYALTVTEQIYETLVRFGPGGELEPELAAAWHDVEPGVLRIELRHGVRFHDGTVVDAAAVAASFERLLDPATGSRGRFVVAMIEEIRVIDEHTLEFVSDPPFYALPSHLAFPAAAIVPVARADTLGREPVGSGPFRFTGWRDGERIDLAANEDHWRGPPAIDEVRFRILPDSATRHVELRAGGVDLLFDPAPDAFASMATDPDIAVTAEPSTRTVYLGFNLENPLFGDVRVRRAIAHAIDERAIAEDFLLGRAEPAATFLPPIVAYAATFPDPYPYDPALARSLLAEVGLGEVRLGLNLPRGSDVEPIGELIQAMLGQVGIEVVIRSEPFAANYASLTSGRVDVWLDFWDSVMFDPYLTLYSFLHSSEIGTNNISRYSAPEVDALLEEASREPDVAQRASLWLAIQDRMAADLPLLPLVHPQALRAADPDLRGVVAPGSSFLLDLRGAYFAPGD